MSGNSVQRHPQIAGVIHGVGMCVVPLVGIGPQVEQWRLEGQPRLRLWKGRIGIVESLVIGRWVLQEGIQFRLVAVVAQGVVKSGDLIGEAAVLASLQSIYRFRHIAAVGIHGHVEIPAGIEGRGEGVAQALGEQIGRVGHPQTVVLQVNGRTWTDRQAEDLSRQVVFPQPCRAAGAGQFLHFPVIGSAGDVHVKVLSGRTGQHKVEAMVVESVGDIQGIGIGQVGHQASAELDGLEVTDPGSIAGGYQSGQVQLAVVILHPEHLFEAMVSRRVLGREHAARQVDLLDIAQQTGVIQVGSVGDHANGLLAGRQYRQRVHGTHQVTVDHGCLCESREIRDAKKKDGSERSDSLQGSRFWMTLKIRQKVSDLLLVIPVWRAAIEHRRSGDRRYQVSAIEMRRAVRQLPVVFWKPVICPILAQPPKSEIDDPRFSRTPDQARFFKGYLPDPEFSSGHFLPAYLIIGIKIDPYCPNI